MERTRLHRSAELIGLLFVFFIYAFLKKGNLTLYAGDQGVYFYAAHLWSQGIVPYRDFFISHPPVELLLPTLVTLLFGSNLTVLNIIPAILGALSGGLVYLIARRAFDGMTAVIATAFFLLSSEHLIVSLYYTGQNIALVFLLVATLLFVRQRWCASGIAFGIGVAAGAHQIVAVFALSLVLFLRNRRLLVPFFGGFLVTAGMIHGLFSFVAGKEFWMQVYGYHLSKPETTTHLATKGEVFAFLFRTHWLLIILAIAGIGYSVISCRDRRRACPLLAVVSIAIAGAYTVFLGFMNPVFVHYALPIVPFAAVLAAMICAVGIRWMHAAIQNRMPGVAIATGAVAIVLVVQSFIHTTASYRAERRLMAFPHAETLGARIADDLSFDQTLYGDFVITPLVAILHNRRIAAREVDSSVMRFESGLYRIHDVIDALEADRIGAVLTRVNRGIGYYPPFRSYLKEKFIHVETVSPPGTFQPVEYWRRRTD